MSHKNCPINRQLLNNLNKFDQKSVNFSDTEFYKSFSLLMQYVARICRKNCPKNRQFLSNLNKLAQKSVNFSDDKNSLLILPLSSNISPCIFPVSLQKIPGQAANITVSDFFVSDYCNRHNLHKGV